MFFRGMKPEGLGAGMPVDSKAADAHGTEIQCDRQPSPCGAATSGLQDTEQLSWERLSSGQNLNRSRDSADGIHWGKRFLSISRAPCETPGDSKRLLTGTGNEQFLDEKPPPSSPEAL